MKLITDTRKVSRSNQYEHRKRYHPSRMRHYNVERPSRFHEKRVITQINNMRWWWDVFETVCWNGGDLRAAFSMDCCDRGTIRYEATTAGISGDIIRDLVAQTIESRSGFVDQLPRGI